MSALYGVMCPYCQKKSYVQVPDTPAHDPNAGEVEAHEETPCVACEKIIVAYTKSDAKWGVRRKKT